MGKLPSLPSSNLTALTESEMRELDPSNITVTVRGGKRTVEGYDYNGNKVVREITLYNGVPHQKAGFRQLEHTECGPLSIDDRKNIARDLKKKGMSQTDIAKRLGVSQKTISNDLRK